ncbi:hypothetical protein M201_gp03 [Haloarcula californiae tailed virus 2]|uniref:Uncharacterized protein n=1 Tax=Haloarcula californiae tailed virus 2 TaxID=1273747 RepID=R4TA16_9CAUD|nr:hypothetical protein M201_gp03 [Haloarcula californiae tailed virus 2]AGM11780.1 hypothetical protein HCTV2_3 [Haloarcula californiae tailed virus 2]
MMASTYGPQVVFDLPSGEDAAQRIASTCGLESGEATTWGKHSGEAPDDVRSAIGDALMAAYGGWVDPWALLPRRVDYDAARLEVTLAPVASAYEDEGEGPEVGDSPRQRLLGTLSEYHDELGADQVEREALLEETEGDEDTLREELERLEREGEVYQPAPDVFCRTGA